MSRALLDEKVKTWETLNKEMEGVTSLICCQDFNATKQDSFEDNHWGEEDEEGEVIGNGPYFAWDVYWKVDTVCRMLDENLDYGKYNESGDEREDISSPNYDCNYHSERMEVRADIVDKVAWDWVFEEHWDESIGKMVKGKVHDLESAQAYCNELIEKVGTDDFYKHWY